MSEQNGQVLHESFTNVKGEVLGRLSFEVEYVADAFEELWVGVLQLVDGRFVFRRCRSELINVVLAGVSLGNRFCTETICALMVFILVAVERRIGRSGSTGNR